MLHLDLSLEALKPQQCFGIYVEQPHAKLDVEGSLEGQTAWTLLPQVDAMEAFAISPQIGQELISAPGNTFLHAGLGDS